jgi:hypothetical protein
MHIHFITSNLYFRIETKKIIFLKIDILQLQNLIFETEITTLKIDLKI